MDIFALWNFCNMRHLWQWFCGYVCILLKGRQVNRFLNLCSRNGISFWKISYGIEQTVRAHISLKTFYLLKPYLRKTKTRLKIVGRRGFPFWCHRHPKLKWLLVVLAFLLCLVCYSYSFIWDIKIQGNTKVSSYALEKFLLEQNISTGLKRDEIDCANIEYLLRQNFDQLGWVSVYFDHTNLCIDVKESLYDTYDDIPIIEDRQYNLITDKDAYIYSIVTRAGTAVVKEGSYVKQGDILVLGQYQVLDDAGEVKSVQNVFAEALIYGDVEYYFCTTLTEMEILSLKISGLYSDKMIEEIAEEKLNDFVKKLEQNDVIILDKNVMINKEEKNIVFWMQIKAREQIGINVPVEEIREYEFE